MIVSLALSLCLAAGAERPTVAVLYFDNNTKSGDLDVMRKGLADMMVTDLVAWDGVAVVERDKFEAVVAELKLQRTKYFDQATAVKIGKFLEAKYLLTGSMTLSAEKLILDAKLLDTGKNQVVVTARADGSKDDIFPIEQELVERIAAGIELKVKNEAHRKKAKVPSLEALLDYSKALDLADQGRLDEAQKAFTALVSKTPSFLMARDRKEKAAKALVEFQKRRRDLVTDSALRVGKAADDVIASSEGRFESLSRSQQELLVFMRQVKGQFLARALKRHLSEHDTSLRYILTPKRAQAVETLRAWHANQTRLVTELSFMIKTAGTGSTAVPKPDATFMNDLADAFFKAPDWSASIDNARRALLWFVFWGRLEDGLELSGSSSSYTVAPTWADLSPADAKASWALLDADIERAVAAAETAPPERKRTTQHDAMRLLDQKAELLAWLQRDDDAVASYQRVLDLFPTDERNSWREKEIRKLIGTEHDYQRDLRERLAKGLKTCDDMDLRVGRQASSFWSRHQGIDGLEAFWAMVLKACPPSEKTRSALGNMATDFALEAARADDCERSRVFWERSLELGASTSDLVGYLKNHIPWCPLADVIKKVEWVTFTWDRMPRGLDAGFMSVKSTDGKQLALSARNENGSIELQLYLVPEGAGWKCREATWRTRDGAQVSGACTVKLTKEAKDRGDYDEGTFDTSFTYEQDGHPFTTKVTDGEFRLRRD